MQDTVGYHPARQWREHAEEFDDSDFDAAIARIQAANDSGQIRRFTGNDYTQDLLSGNVAAAIAWSGDIIQLLPAVRERRDPVRDTAIGPDDLVGQHDGSEPGRTQDQRGRLMNYYYDPAVAAQVAAWVNYICPVQGAQEAMAEIDEELVDNPLIFPDEATLADAEGAGRAGRGGLPRRENTATAVYA